MATDQTEAPSPPETDRDPVTEDRHGETFTDPYRWLEDSDDERVQAWTDEQNAYADCVLDTPQANRLEAVYEDLARVTDYETVEAAGDRYFQRIGGPEEDHRTLYVFESLAALRAGDGRVVVDPNELGDTTTSVDWYVPGPEGRTLAYGVAEGGDEQYDVVVVDVDDGDEITRLDAVGRAQPNAFGWVPAAGDEAVEGDEVAVDDEAAAGDDGTAASPRPRGFYYVATGGVGDGSQLEKAVRYHALDGETDRLVTDAFEPQEWPSVDTDGETVVVGRHDGRTQSDVFLAHGPPEETSLTPVVEGRDATFFPSVSDGRLYLSTDLDAPFRRVLTAGVDEILASESTSEVDEGGETSETDATTETDTLDVFTELVPESDAVIRDVVPAGDRVYVHAHRDARSVLTLHDPEEPDAEPTTVDLPAFASVDGLAGTDDGTVFAVVQSFSEPRSVRRVTPDGETETLVRQDVAPAFEIETSQEWFESADGTEIPAFVVRRAGVEPDGTNPAVVTGYGGFRINSTPSFARFRIPFLRAGGVFVVATLRGGAEYGAEWHAAGRREHKQNVFDDAIAVSEGLIERGWAHADRLAAVGGSNGGLLVGALLTQRPDLYRAVACHVPLLDMLRFHEFLLGESWTPEYGSPDDPEAFEYLREYSPYHNAPETAYPATLFTTALGDTRVHPAHARKMTARVQRRNTGPHPVVLRIDDDAGHGTGKPLSKEVREQTDRWGFLSHELGIDPDALAR
ncbi:prolyl oligopeptidase family protein [Halobaculum sp. MBLA0147]|uniref:prolyl oligopeptidase family serine peptidase n=1 Tax=Halobaculum sp. MBLA0147 TaxID=3079934 RepID=UPI003525D2FF